MSAPSAGTLKSNILSYLPNTFFRSYWANEGFPVEDGQYADNDLSTYQNSYLTEWCRACIDAWETFSDGLLIPTIDVLGGSGPPNGAPHNGQQACTIMVGGLIPTRPFSLTFRNFTFNNLNFPNGQYTTQLRHYNQAISNGILTQTLSWARTWSWTGTINGQTDAGISGWITTPSGPAPGSWTRGQIKSNTSEHTLGSGNYVAITRNGVNGAMRGYINSNVLTGEYLQAHVQAIAYGFADTFNNWLPNAVWETNANGVGICQVGGAVTGGKILAGRVNS